MPPTPLYNMCILEDMCILTHHQIISMAILPYQAMRDALLLFKIWLTQRDIRFCPDSLDSHTCCLLLSYLIQTRVISPTQSTALVAFQSLLTFIKDVDFGSALLDFTTTEVTSMSKDTDAHTKEEVFYASIYLSYTSHTIPYT